MAERVLVACARMNGSTAEIAAAGAGELRPAGLEVDLLPVRDAADPSSYAAVILGSAIRGGKVLPRGRPVRVAA